MNLHLIVPSLSLIIQLISLFLAFRMLKTSGNRMGIIFVLAICLMSFRRFISLLRFFLHGTIVVDLLAESVALTISILILYGIVLISRFLKSAGENRKAAAFAEKRYRALFDQSPDGVLLMNGKGDIVDYNDAVHMQLGYTREEFNGLQIADIDPVESEEEIAASFERVIREGKAQFEVKHTAKGGELRDVLVMVQRMELEGEIFFHTIWRDITDQKKAETALRESEDKFRSIFNEATDGIMFADADTKIQLGANKAMCRMLGYSSEEVIGLAMEDIHPREALPRIKEVFERQQRGEISLAPEIPMLRKDGSIFYADINAAGVTLGGNACLIGIFRDITERKQAEEKLKANERRLAESQRIAHIGSWEHNIETNEIFWSNELFRLFGLDPAKDVADFHRFFSMVHPEDQSLLQKSIKETLGLHKPFNIDYRFIRRDGSTRIIRAMAELMPDSAGKLVRLCGTGQDITERLLAEEKIKKNEEHIRNILDTVDDGFIVLDRDYRIMSANKAYCNQVSLPYDEVVEKRCYEVSHLVERPCFEMGEECAVRESFMTGASHSAIHRHVNEDGEILFVETKAFPNKDKAGNVVSVIETTRNITERHLLAAEQLKTQKLEAIGTLAGGIAHDFNNLLQGVFGYVSMAKMEAQQPEKVTELLNQAEKALSLSVNLTTQLLTFSKGGNPVKKQIDLRPVVDNATKFALSGSRSDYRLQVDSDLWPAEVDEGQIAQVIQNIVLNASEAMPDGGLVHIAAGNLEAGTGPRRVRIVIKDTGTGIPESYRSKIFDPYFTTKPKGSGLGLATSYSIVKNHGGSIEVLSTKNEGTSFTIVLPACMAAGSELRMVPPSADVQKQRQRILLMDDETVVRDVAKSMIETLGNDIELASHGEEAIGKYQGALVSDNPFDLVILDLTVKGGLGGRETLRKLLEIDPEVRAVVSSGYSDTSAASEYRDLGFRGLLNKPYTIKDLKECLNNLF